MLIEEGVRRLHELEHIQMGGTNLLRSTALKKNMDYMNVWNISSAVWHVTDDTTFGRTPHRNRSFRGDINDNATYYGIHDALYLQENTTYTMSCWVLFDSDCADDEGVVIQMSCKDKSGSYYYATKPLRARDTTKGKWVQLVHTFSTRDLYADTLSDFCVQTDKRKFHGYVGDCKLELGSHYTDWSPNPHDLLLWDNPIGSVKIMGSDVNPSEIIGGIWIQTCQGRNPIGVGTTKDVNNVSKTFQLGATGGEFVHTQTINELVPHNHGQHIINDGGSTTGKTYRCDYVTDGLAVSVYPQNIETMSTGGGKPMNIVSPFQAFYFWMRTA